MTLKQLALLSCQHAFCSKINLSVVMDMNRTLLIALSPDSTETLKLSKQSSKHVSCKNSLSYQIHFQSCIVAGIFPT